MGSWNEPYIDLDAHMHLIIKFVQENWESDSKTDELVSELDTACRVAVND